MEHSPKAENRDETSRLPAERLRVILLAPTVVLGGITTWTLALQKYSDRRRVRYRVLDTSKLYDPLGRRLRIRGAILGVRDAIKRFCQMIACLWTFKPHLVYITCAPSIGFVVRDCPYVLLLSLLHVPCLVHLRGGLVKGFFGGSFLRRSVVRAALKRVRLIIAITRPIERIAGELFGQDRVMYFPNMIDDDVVPGELRAQQRGPDGKLVRLLHVGAQIPSKGSLDLVEAVKLVQSPVQCDLVGDAAPEYTRMIGDRIAEFGIGDRIRLTGEKRGRDKHLAFESADMFVFPSHTEGFPNVILEAMAYGLPIVATDVGNIREMIGADTDRPAGVILDRVNPVSPDQLAETIDRLVADPRERKRLSENGRYRIKRYLASAVVPKLEDLLRGLVSCQASVARVRSQE